METVPLERPLVADRGEVERLARFMHEEYRAWAATEEPDGSGNKPFDNLSQRARDRYYTVSRGILERFPRG